VILQAKDVQARPRKISSGRAVCELGLDYYSIKDAPLSSSWILRENGDERAKGEYTK